MNITRIESKPSKDIEVRPAYPLTESGGTYYLEPLNGANDVDGKTPLHYWTLLRENARKLLGFGVLGVLLGWLVTVTQTPIFRSVAAIEIQSMSQSEALYGIIERDWTTGSSGRDALPPEAYLQTQLEMLNSRTFMRRVHSKLESRPRPPGESKPTSPLLAALFEVGIAAPDNSDGELPPLSVEVSVRPNTRIVDIKSESIDRELSAEVANTVAQEFISYNLENQSETAERTMTWLRGQLEEMRTKVDVAEADLKHYSEEVGLIFQAEEPETEKQKLDELQRQLSAASVARIDKQSAYEVAASEPGAAVGMADVARQKSDLAQMQLDLTNMLRTYTDKHRDVIALKDRIAGLSEMIQSHTRDMIAERRSEYEASRLREKYLQDAYYQQLKRVSSTAQKAIRYGELENEVNRNRSLYENLLQKATALSISTAMRASSQIRFVEQAEPPSAPFSPRLWFNLVFGLLTGLMSGLGLIWVNDFADQRVRTPGESESLLRLPELGSIPVVSGDGRLETRPKLGVWTRLKRLASGNAEPVLQAGLEKTAWLSSKSGNVSATAVTEAFHGVVASVLSSLRHGNDYRVLLVTSASQGDGKPSVSSQLACALAEVGHTVVLVDCDLRASSLHSVFATPNTRGLSTLFLAESLDDEHFKVVDGKSDRAVIYPAKMDRLFILPAGPRPSSTPTALHSPRLGEVIHRLRAEYDFVVLDTPPMLEVSDARILGRHADAAILVLRAGKTPRSSALTVKRRLSEDRLPILGVVLNGWSPSGAASSYYYN